jgi:hypothetical protein
MPQSGRGWYAALRMQGSAAGARWIKIAGGRIVLGTTRQGFLGGDAKLGGFVPRQLVAHQHGVCHPVCSDNDPIGGKSGMMGCKLALLKVTNVTTKRALRRAAEKKGR